MAKVVRSAERRVSGRRTSRPSGSGSIETSALESSRSLRSPFPESCSCSSCSCRIVQRLGRTAASRVQDEQMVQQNAPACAALSWPMVSALKPRSTACARRLATSPHHPLSRARFSVLTPATHLPGSSPACHRRLAEAAQPSARAYAAGERDSGPHGLRAGGSVRLAMRAPRSHARSRRWAFLGLWCTAQAAEGVLYTLSAPIRSHPLIYEWVG